MSDIRIVWSGSFGDWSYENGQLEQGDDLESAILVSLFTDRLATPDFRLTDGTTDRRGWWGDSFGDPGDGLIGSDLWQLERAKVTTKLVPQAKQMVADALDWLITDGVVASWIIDAAIQNGSRLAISIIGVKPDGSKTAPFRFSWAWAGTGV
jgi:phage gp46-like protein